MAVSLTSITSDVVIAALPRFAKSCSLQRNASRVNREKCSLQRGVAFGGAGLAAAPSQSDRQDGGHGPPVALAASTVVSETFAQTDGQSFSAYGGFKCQDYAPNVSSGTARFPRCAFSRPSHASAASRARVKKR